MPKKFFDQKAIDVAADGSIFVSVRSDAENANYTVALDYDGSNNLLYQGRVATGQLKTNAAWRDDYCGELPVDK